jgi:purine-binding chemotaxis protein CheW
MSAKKDNHKSEKLADQQNALGLYIDALLSEVDWEAQDLAYEEELAGRCESSGPPSPTEDTRATESRAPVVPIGRKGGEKLALPLQPPEIDVRQNAPEPDDSAAATPEEHSAGKEQWTIPQWAQSTFQCLQFTIGGMEVAAPLGELNGIIPLPEAMTVLPGQAPWFLGLVRNRGQNVQVVDLGQVMTSHTGNASRPDPKDAQYIMLIGNGRWGLCSDSVSNVITLHKEDIKWQKERLVPYVAGTVIDRMCSLLDIQILVSRLNTGL